MEHYRRSCLQPSSLDSWIVRAVQRMPMNRMVALRARLLPILMVPLVVLPLWAAGNVQYFCHLMGRVMDECCCPSVGGVQKHEHLGCSSEIKSRDCCERLERGSGNLAAAVRERASSVEAMPALAAPESLATAVRQPETRDISLALVIARAPPPRGPPLFIVNCALLI